MSDLMRYGTLNFLLKLLGYSVITLWLIFTERFDSLGDWNYLNYLLPILFFWNGPIYSYVSYCVNNNLSAEYLKRQIRFGFILNNIGALIWMVVIWISTMLDLGLKPLLVFEESDFWIISCLLFLTANNDLGRVIAVALDEQKDFQVIQVFTYSAFLFCVLIDVLTVDLFVTDPVKLLCVVATISIGAWLTWFGIGVAKGNYSLASGEGKESIILARMHKPGFGWLLLHSLIQRVGNSLDVFLIAEFSNESQFSLYSTVRRFVGFGIALISHLSDLLIASFTVVKESMSARRLSSRITVYVVGGTLSALVLFLVVDLNPITNTFGIGQSNFEFKIFLLGFILWAFGMATVQILTVNYKAAGEFGVLLRLATVQVLVMAIVFYEGIQIIEFYFVSMLLGGLVLSGTGLSLLLEHFSRRGSQ